MNTQPEQEQKILNLVKNNDQIKNTIYFTTSQIAQIFDDMNNIDKKSIASHHTIWQFETYIKPILEWLEQKWDILNVWDDLYRVL